MIVDLAAIAKLTGSIATATKQASKVLDHLGDGKTKQALSELGTLQAQLVKMGSVVMEYQTAINELSRENEELKAQIALKEEMIQVEGSPFFYKREQRSPYCGGCWAGKGVAIPLVYAPGDGVNRPHHACTFCGKQVFHSEWDFGEPDRLALVSIDPPCIRGGQSAPTEVEFRHGVYWKREDDIPFCPKCWEARRVLMHLSVYKVGKTNQNTICQQCGFQGLIPAQPD